MNPVTAPFHVVADYSYQLGQSLVNRCLSLFKRQVQSPSTEKDLSTSKVEAIDSSHSKKLEQMIAKSIMRKENFHSLEERITQLCKDQAAKGADYALRAKLIQEQVDKLSLQAGKEIYKSYLESNELKETVEKHIDFYIEDAEQDEQYNHYAQASFATAVGLGASACLYRDLQQFSQKQWLIFATTSVALSLIAKQLFFKSAEAFDSEKAVEDDLNEQMQDLLNLSMAEPSKTTDSKNEEDSLLEEADDLESQLKILAQSSQEIAEDMMEAVKAYIEEGEIAKLDIKELSGPSYPLSENED